MRRRLSNPKAIAERGEEIYAKNRADLEAEHLGKFAAIDIETEGIYIGESAEDAFAAARAHAPNGLFHLVKIGEQGAFRVGYVADARVDWLFR